MKPEIKRPTEITLKVYRDDYETEQWEREVWVASAVIGPREFDITTGGSAGQVLDVALKWARDRRYSSWSADIYIKITCDEEARRRFNAMMAGQDAHRNVPDMLQSPEGRGKGLFDV